MRGEGGPREGAGSGDEGGEWGPAETWAHISACRLEKLGPCPQDPLQLRSPSWGHPGSRGDMGASHPVLSPHREKHRQLSTGPEASRGPTGPGEGRCYPPQSPFRHCGWGLPPWGGPLFSDPASASSPWGPTGRAVPGARGPPGGPQVQPSRLAALGAEPHPGAADVRCPTGCAAPRQVLGDPRALSVFCLTPSYWGAGPRSLLGWGCQGSGGSGVQG